MSIRQEGATPCWHSRPSLNTMRCLACNQYSCSCCRGYGSREPVNKYDQFQILDRGYSSASQPRKTLPQDQLSRALNSQYIMSEVYYKRALFQLKGPSLVNRLQSRPLPAGQSISLQYLLSFSCDIQMFLVSQARNRPKVRSTPFTTQRAMVKYCACTLLQYIISGTSKISFSGAVISS